MIDERLLQIQQFRNVRFISLGCESHILEKWMVAAAYLRLCRRFVLTALKRFYVV